MTMTLTNLLSYQFLNTTLLLTKIGIRLQMHLTFFIIVLTHVVDAFYNIQDKLFSSSSYTENTPHFNIHDLCKLHNSSSTIEPYVLELLHHISPHQRHLVPQITYSCRHIKPDLSSEVCKFRCRPPPLSLYPIKSSNKTGPLLSICAFNPRNV